MEPKKKTPETLKKKKCFIIIPFGGWFNSYYEEIYLPAIKEAGMTPKRADDLFRVGNIVNDIWTSIKEADIVIADLTGKNPNVFYKLGLAHALNKPVILTTSSMDDVPFDLRRQHVIEFEKNQPNWGKNIKEQIVKAITETLKHPEKAILPAYNGKAKSNHLNGSALNKNKVLPEVNGDVTYLNSKKVTNGEIKIENHFLVTKDESRISNMIKEGFGDDTIINLLKKDMPLETLVKSIEKLREGIKSKNLKVNQSL